MQNQSPIANNNFACSKRGFETYIKEYAESNRRNELLDLPKESLIGNGEVEESKQDFFTPINKECMMESNRKAKDSFTLFY